MIDVKGRLHVRIERVQNNEGNTYQHWHVNFTQREKRHKESNTVERRKEKRIKTIMKMSPSFTDSVSHS